MFSYTSSGAVMFKAGKSAPTGISTDSMSGAMMQAVGFINNATRKNWADVYDSLNSDYKFMLQEIASNLVAMYVINYDVWSYTSRAGAQTMLDLLRDRALQGITELKDKKTEDFMTGA